MFFLMCHKFRSISFIITEIQVFLYVLVKTELTTFQMKKLEYLDISNLPGGSITAAVVSQLTRQCDNLECLNVSLNLTVDDKCIQEVVKYGQKMKKLYCVNCSLSDEGKGSNLNDVLSRGRHGHERMIVGFTTTYAISAYLHLRCEFKSHSW